MSMKTCLNVSLQKCYEPKTSQCLLNVTCDKQTRSMFMFDPRALHCITVILKGRILTFSYAPMDCLAMKLRKIQMSLGLAEKGHVTVRLSVPVRV